MTHVSTAESVQLSDLDFEIPGDLVAQRPLAARDACRLLCLRRGTPPGLEDRTFAALDELLRPGDLLVRNVSRVLPARLLGRRPDSDTPCELLLLEPCGGDGSWWALARPGRRLECGARVRFATGSEVEVCEVAPDGRRRVRSLGADLRTLADAVGTMPLPPYVRRQADAADRDDYQTVYARVDGSAAAPTAGLHFTPELLQRIAARGVQTADVILHVGLATFQPIRTADPLLHPMHAESFEVPATTLAALDAVGSGGGRVVAVGTTVVRTLESLRRWRMGEAGALVEAAEGPEGVRGRTRLFLYPPQPVPSVDVLVTNFHLPRTTLILMVDAFAGRDAIRAAYRHAVEGRYRFFSYGDAMWIE